MRLSRCLVTERADALFVGPDFFFNSRRVQLNDARRENIPFQRRTGRATMPMPAV